MVIRMLHPPRTGGSSVADSWSIASGTDGEYQSHRAPTPADFSYGFVRNPWDRVVSMYHNFAEAKGFSFEDFVRQEIAGRDKTVPFSFNPKPHDYYRPCAFWMRGSTFTGRFENRDQHLEILAKILDRPIPQLHRGESDRKPYTEYYNDETKALVAKDYEVDISLYGYRYGE